MLLNNFFSMRSNFFFNNSWPSKIFLTVWFMPNLQFESHDNMKSQSKTQHIQHLRNILIKMHEISQPQSPGCSQPKTTSTNESQQQRHSQPSSSIWGNICEEPSQSTGPLAQPMYTLTPTSTNGAGAETSCISHLQQCLSSSLYGNSDWGLDENSSSTCRRSRIFTGKAEWEDSSHLHLPTHTRCIGHWPLKAFIHVHFPSISFTCLGVSEKELRREIQAEDKEEI